MKKPQPDQTKLVLEAIKSYGPVRPTDLIDILKISSKTVYKHLARLLDNDQIVKNGITPRVFYKINTSIENEIFITNKDDQLIENNYIYVSPTGEITRGINGFQIWTDKNHFDFKSEKSKYITKLKQINKLKSKGYVSAKKIILSGKKDLFLDNIFFSDFYNIDYFGKTKLGQLVYLSKSSQNKDLIKEIAKLIKPALTEIIEKYNIQLICFIPPTIDRKVQFLDVLKQALKIKLKEVDISKIPNPTKIPQKTLRKLEDRILNAQASIAVNPTQKFKTNVLIIDDATGSGATINETARKICKITKDNIKIYGYSVVGSYKGFDVISEV